MANADSGAAATAAATPANYQVRALERALDILDAFSLDEPALSLTELAARTGLAKSTATRLLAVLEERGYLERSAETERYRIGVRAFEVGSIYIQTTTVEAEAQPALQRLARECHQTANLGILDRGEVVHLAVVPPDRPIRFSAAVGQREYAHCTSLGKALLATLEDGRLEAAVGGPELPGRTARTLRTLDALRADLARVRERGVALDDEESYSGLRCLAAPIYDDKGRAIAAISISGPLAEFTEDNMPRYTEAVLRAARDVSSRLGNAVRPDGPGTRAGTDVPPGTRRPRREEGQ